MEPHRPTVRWCWGRQWGRGHAPQPYALSGIFFIYDSILTTVIHNTVLSIITSGKIPVDPGPSSLRKFCLHFSFQCAFIFNNEQ